MKERLIICSLSVLILAASGSGAAKGMTTDTLTVTGPLSQTGTASTNAFAGQVGIGTTTPAAGEELHIKGTNWASVEVEAPVGYAELRLVPYGSLCPAYITWGKTNTTSDLAFWSVWSSAVVGVLTHDGKLGLGTNAPAQMLHVTGNGLFNGGLAVGTGRALYRGSVAEGYATEANAANAHAEGYYASADSDSAHAEGFGTWAEASHSHAEGYMTMAAGVDSHSAGSGAEAMNDNTYVWSDSTCFPSTTNRQFSVFAKNGIRLLGGPTVGMPGGDISMGSYTNMPP